MFVIGNGGEGKSTLIKAMEHEPTLWTSVTNIFIAPKEVDGVSQRTAGIIPHVFKSRLYGDVLFYDFAGQEAYYSSHAAVIKSAVNTCPPVFILVVGLHRDEKTIIYSISYWLGIISNQCTSMDSKAPLIIVGSHADLVEEWTEVERIKNIISVTVHVFCTLFNLVDIIAIDCRYSNSDGINLLRRHIEASCNLIRTKLSVNLNSHMFLIYLLDNFSNKFAVTLQEVKDQLIMKSSMSSKLSNKDKVLPFIPTTIPHLVDICIQLNDKGHVLFLLREISPEKSFIIIDKSALLTELNGTMFAPEDFRQHCQLATSTGVVSQSKLAEHFWKFDVELLIHFLSQLELAIPIEDPKVLQLIEPHLAKTCDPVTLSQEKYLFCPALIRLEAQPDVFVYQAELRYRFGWSVSCVRTNDFFDPRFLHVLILRLALSLGLAPVVDPDFPALQRQCSVWKTGVCWCTTDGVKILVEVVNQKKVVVLIQAHKISCELLKEQNSVLNKVLDTIRDYCRSVVTEEVLLSPANVSYPFSESTPTVVFSIKSVAESIARKKDFVVSTNGIKHLPVTDLLPVEVYSNLGVKILQSLFTESNCSDKNLVSDDFLSALSCSWSRTPQLVNIICSTMNITLPQYNQENLYAALKGWRDRKQGNDCRGIEDTHQGTYRSLRQILDQLSVFVGRNLLVSPCMHSNLRNLKSHLCYSILL